MGRMRKSTRKINGETYHIVGAAKPITEKEAHIKAKAMRAKGTPTRVIKCSGGYRVYARYTFYKSRRKK